MKPDIHPDFARDRLSPHFVYESFDEKTQLFFNRGSVGFVLKGWPLVGASLQSQGEISEFLKEEENLPAGASFQVLMIGTSDIESYLTNWASFRKGDIFKALAKRRTDYLRQLAKEEGTIKDIFLLISVTIPQKTIHKGLIADMQRRRDVLKSTLGGICLETNDVDSTELVRILRLFFDWEEDSHPEINPYDVLSEQILRGDFQMDVEADGLINHSEHKKTAIVALEVVKRPKVWALSMMDLFLGNELRRGEQIKSDFMQSFSLQILPSQLREKSIVKTKRESLGKSINSGLVKWLPGIPEEYEDIDAALVSTTEGERLVTIRQNIILKDSPDKIKQRTYEYRSLLRRNGFHFVPCTYDHLPVLLSCLPMQTVEEVSGTIVNSVGGLSRDLSDIGRGIKTVSGEAKVLLPIVGEWKGDLCSPGMILNGRRGQILYWSPFGRALIPSKKQPVSNENYNACLCGVPGSGKSVYMVEYMLSTLGIGGKVFVLDYGRSFKRACQILKGNYIEFDLKTPMSLNPFSDISEREEDFESREDALACIQPILATMAAPKAGVSDLQSPMLQRALRAVWNAKKSQTEITDIADWLLLREESYARDLGNMLFPFTKEGFYGRFFSGKANVSLNHKIVVIESDLLRNIPDLLTVVVQMMIVQINQSMVKSDRQYPFMIVIDEAWKLLQGKASGAFIAEASRIARKYKGSVTLATQHLTDYFRAESPAASIAFESSSWKIMLKQNPESLWAMRANPSLASFVKEDWQLNLLQSVHSNPPHYSEAALFGPDVNGVITRLRLDPFTLLLASTNPEDYSALENRVKKGMSVANAIEDVLITRGLA